MIKKISETKIAMNRGKKYIRKRKLNWRTDNKVFYSVEIVDPVFGVGKTHTSILLSSVSHTHNFAILFR